MTRRTVILGAAGALAVVLAGVYGARRAYFVPAAELRARLAADRGVIRDIEAAMKDRARNAAALRSIAATTLGATEEEVDARLRERLSEIAGSRGLSGVQVETSRPAPEASPAGRARIRGELGRALRKQTDFWAVRGSMAGQGTLEQVLGVLAALQAQPWVHRVESFSVKPEGNERDRFEVRVGVSTLVMPDLLPASHSPPGVVPLPVAAQVALGPVVSKNIFRRGVEEAALPAVAATPARSPYADWKLTGVVEGAGLAEAWLHNTRNNERLTLTPGALVLDARLVAASGERAVFEIGGERFEVFNGQTLEQRRPAAGRAEAAGGAGGAGGPREVR